VSEGREYVVSSPWLVVIPGLVIAATVLSISRLSRVLKEGNTP
jgi:peptide/nickel transport system permease protein